MHLFIYLFCATGARQFNPPAVPRSGTGSAPQTPGASGSASGGQGQGQGSDPATSPSPSSSPAVLSGYQIKHIEIFNSFTLKKPTLSHIAYKMTIYIALLLSLSLTTLLLLILISSIPLLSFIFLAAPPGFSSPISTPAPTASESVKSATTNISPNPTSTETDKEKNVLSKEEKKKKKDEDMKILKDGKEKDNGKDKEKEKEKEKDGKDNKDKESKESGKDGKEKEKDKEIKSTTTTSTTATSSTAAAVAAAVPAVVKSKGLNANAKVSYFTLLHMRVRGTVICSRETNSQTVPFLSLSIFLTLPSFHSLSMILPLSHSLTHTNVYAGLFLQSWCSSVYPINAPSPPIRPPSR